MLIAWWYNVYGCWLIGAMLCACYHNLCRAVRAVLTKTVQHWTEINREYKMFYIVNENLCVLFTYENRLDAVAAFDRLWKAGKDVSIEDENDRLNSLAFLNRHKKRQLQRAIDNPIQLT